MFLAEAVKTKAWKSSDSSNCSRLNEMGGVEEVEECCQKVERNANFNSTFMKRPFTMKVKGTSSHKQNMRESIISSYKLTEVLQGVDQAEGK